MPSDGEVQTLAPLTNELIAQVLSARGYNFGTDDDGDIGGMWDDNLIWFFRRGSQGEMLQVRTLAAAEFTVDDVPRLYAFCNEWNHDRLWPKAFVHVNDDGYRASSARSSPTSNAASRAQLDQLIGCGVSTGCDLAEAAAGLTPWVSAGRRAWHRRTVPGRMEAPRDQHRAPFPGRPARRGRPAQPPPVRKPAGVRTRAVAERHRRDHRTSRRGPGLPGRVVIEPLPDGALRVTDNGIGLTEAEVHTFLASVGRTSSATTLASPGRTTWVSSASGCCPASWSRTPSRWSPARPRGARP